MAENENLLERGFKNIAQDGKIAGFQLEVKTGYYRGTFLSLLEGFEVTIDGETFTREQTKFMVGGRAYALDELANLTDVRWQFQDTGTVLINKPGGLKVGMHDVKVVQKTRVSYMPVQPSVYTFKKKMALVL